MKNSFNKYARFLKLLLLVIFPIFLISCLYRKPEDVVISNKKITLTPTPLTIKCPTPFYRTRKRGKVCFTISKHWILARAKDGSNKAGMEFEDGNIIFLDVSLIDSNKKRYLAKGYSLSGGFSAHYPNLPENVKIVEMVVTSSSNIVCDKISWRCYDPI